MKIQEAFKSVEQKLRADLAEARAAMSHAVSKGAANEEAAKTFFRSYLPRNLDISAGFLIDSNGEISKQLDIIIHDAARTPVLYDVANLRVIPVECAYAVIEVKTNLNLSEVDSCMMNMISAKSLVKKSYYPEGIITSSTIAYGTEYDNWPLMYFIFAFESAPIDSIAKKLKSINLDRPVDKRIDAIYSLERGLIANFAERKMDAIPSPNSIFILIEQDALLLFYTLIAHYLNQVTMKKFRFSDYIPMIQWNAKYI